MLESEISKSVVNKAFLEQIFLNLTKSLILIKTLKIGIMMAFLQFYHHNAFTNRKILQ